MPTRTATLTSDALWAALLYDGATGRLYWRSTGNAADSTITANGFRTVSLNGHVYFASFVVWWMTHGERPMRHNVITHLNGDKTDNRVTNLQEMSRAASHRHTAALKAARTGAKVVP